MSIEIKSPDYLQKLLNQQANKLKIKEEKYKKLWTAIHIVQNIYEKLI